VASRIPIQNLYYLLIYAWDRLAEGALVDIATIEGTELVNLYASVLINGVRHALRQGLERAYQPFQEEVSGVRGRILITPTTRRVCLPRGRTHCEFDELHVDTLPNRILLATIQRILQVPTLDKTLRDSLRKLVRQLGGIRAISLSKGLFRTIQLHSHNAFYQFLLSICEIVLESSLTTEESGRYRFRDFTRDPKRMPKLFEKFILNFYRRECPQYAVKSERISWPATSHDDPRLLLLPHMYTDISLRKPGKTLIIEAKFYQRTLRKHYEVEKVYSDNLYQLLSYLAGLEARGGQDAEASGILLYPLVDKPVNALYTFGRHSVQISTLDLTKSWQEIRQQLLSLAR
jgi:5-methylcytosine-specific restriction enzyme subunit McrC